MRLISPAPPSKPTAAGAKALHKPEDIAAITGGPVYGKQSGFTLQTMTAEHPRRSAQVRVTAERTAIIDGRGAPAAVQFRLTTAGG
jgi:chaperonin GroEL